MATDTSTTTRVAPDRSGGYRPGTRVQLRRVGGVVWTVVMVAVLTGLVWSRHPDIFVTPLYPGGDEAVNSLLAIRAEHFGQLAGNYSRVGFHHPGAALIYVLAAGETVFHGWLGIVPADYNGQLLGVTVYAVTLLVLAGGALGRAVRSRWAATAAVAAAMLFAAQTPWLGSVWFPHLYAPAFLLFAVAAAMVGSGRTGELPLLVLAGGILVHGHVAFLLFVGVTVLVSLLGWAATHRRQVRGEVSRSRGAVVFAGALLVLFALPIAIRTVREFPDPWRAYLAFGSGGDRDPRSLHDAVRFVTQYWTETPWPLWVYAVAAVVLLVAGLVPGRVVRASGGPGLASVRAVTVWVLGMVVLQTALAVVYAYRGVDHLDQRYVEEFYKAVPLLVVVAAAAVLTAVVLALLREGAATWAARAVVAVVVAAAVAVAARSPALAVLPPTGAAYVPAAVAVRDDPARAGRVIAVEQDQLEVWPAVAGLALLWERMGVSWCVVSPAPVDVALLFTPSHVCPADVDGWRVVATTGSAPPGSTTVWTGETLYTPLTLATASR